MICIAAYEHRKWRGRELGESMAHFWCNNMLVKVTLNFEYTAFNAKINQQRKEKNETKPHEKFNCRYWYVLQNGASDLIQKIGPDTRLFCNAYQMMNSVSADKEIITYLFEISIFRDPHSIIITNHQEVRANRPIILYMWLLFCCQFLWADVDWLINVLLVKNSDMLSKQS